jgi:tRNA threonylcarbamoyladenosine biosynthesis protein TsaB
MLLAIDTSTQWIGLALLDENQVRGESTWQTQNHHTVELAPNIENLLKRCGVKSADLEALGVALGPGSFTSLRIGLALVKGMSLALKLPVIGISTLDFLAAAQPLSDMPLAAILQAGRGRLAVGWYQVESGAWKAQETAHLTTIDELAQQIRKPTWVCGELTPTERQILARKRKNVCLATPSQSLRRPAYLGELAIQRWQAGKTDEVNSLAPIYLHVAEEIPA